ncbi:MAG: GntR family transcriptional regulator [Lachnospiraceae bacterium]|nr:GntR family transcriptional regulator [Lachnospiraceae bacterium]
MISFEQFRMQGDAPIYMQIITYVKQGIVARTILDGDELPSRRVLSATLGVNPMTVQKAYKMLEDEGLIQSRAGAKSCVVYTRETLEQIREVLLEEDARGAVQRLKMMGIRKEDAHELIEKYWE